jgi:hypothetical protein
MRRLIYVLMAMNVMGCGTIVRPHVSTGRDPDQGVPAAGRLLPRRGPDAGLEAGPVVEQVCRTQAQRSGWIVTRYIEGAENCPASTDPENRYTGAIIERYSHKFVGTTMIVCADQPIPRHWLQERNSDVRETCPGAHVKSGAPTIMVIRRVN